MSGLGHGHVVPRPDGAKARCGGPGICPECSMEQARLTGEQAFKDATPKPLEPTDNSGHGEEYWRRRALLAEEELERLRK